MQLCPQLISNLQVFEAFSAILVEAADQVAPRYDARLLVLSLHVSENLHCSSQVGRLYGKFTYFNNILALFRAIVKGKPSNIV